MDSSLFQAPFSRRASVFLTLANIHNGRHDAGDGNGIPHDQAAAPVKIQCWKSRLGAPDRTPGPEKKIWHFAHANGHACRDALSATLAIWLAQCLCDGADLLIPPLTTRWGASHFPDQPERQIGTLSARARAQRRINLGPEASDIKVFSEVPANFDNLLTRFGKAYPAFPMSSAETKDRVNFSPSLALPLASQKRDDADVDKYGNSRISAP